MVQWDVNQDESTREKYVRADGDVVSGSWCRVVVVFKAAGPGAMAKE